MSTATLPETITSEIKPIIPAIQKEATPPQAQEKSDEAKKAELDATVGSLLKPKVVKPTDIINQKIDPTPAQKTEEKKADSKPEQKTESDAEKNFAALRQKAEAAEKAAKEREQELAKLREEYESYKKNPVPKEFEEKLTKAEREKQELQQNLRAADLARDPDFQAKYNKPIEASVKTMSQLFIEAGVDQNEVTRAISTWNEDQFGEWIDLLPKAKQVRCNAAFQRAIELDMERQQELSDSERAWGEIQKQRQVHQEESQKKYMQSLQSERDSVFQEILESQKDVLADENIRKNTEALLDSAIGANGKSLNTRELLASLAKTHVLAHHFARVDSERQKLIEENSSLKKQLEERDGFIKSENRSVPVPSALVPAKSPTDIDATVSALLRPKIRV